MEYKTSAPTDIDTTDTIVPIHLPNKIPEIIKSGDPNPNKVTHKIENIQKYNKFINKFLPIKFSRLRCNSL